MKINNRLLFSSRMNEDDYIYRYIIYRYIDIYRYIYIS